MDILFWKSNSVNCTYRFYMSLILHVRNVRIVCSDTRVIIENLSLEYYDRRNMSAKLIRNCIRNRSTITTSLISEIMWREREDIYSDQCDTSKIKTYATS